MKTNEEQVGPAAAEVDDYVLDIDELAKRAGSAVYIRCCELELDGGQADKLSVAARCGVLGLRWAA
jgi:hypothetical protein